MARSRSLHEVTAKNETTPPKSPAPLASAATGTKRSRDDTEDDKNEDSFYGRRPAKSRSKTAKNLEQDKKNRDYEKERATPGKTPGTKGPVKRLKFDPDIHGAGLEARLLVLQQHDSFKGMVTPRKKVPKDTYETGEKYNTVGNYWETPNTQTNDVPQKIAIPKFSKPKRKNVRVQAKGSEDEGATSSKPITTSTPICSTYEIELSRLIYPASNRAHTYTIDSSFSGSPAPDKSSELPAQHEERRKRMEEVEKQKEEAEKQQLLRERFKIHTEKNTAKKCQQRPVPRAQNPTLFSPSTPVTNTKIVMGTVSEPRPRSLDFRRLTLDEVNDQLWNESGLEKPPAEDIVLRVRHEAAEKGKESARLWAEQMKAKAVSFSNDGTG